ncbi:hypothetical protein ACOSQ3_010287 [Xanthoceras sorbifolium]
MGSIQFEVGTGWLRICSMRVLLRPLLLPPIGGNFFGVEISLQRCGCLYDALVIICPLPGCSLLRAGSLWMQACGFQLLVLFYFIVACKGSLLVYEMELLLVLLWQFWFRKNRAVHGAPLLSLKETVGWSESFLADFQAAIAVSSLRRGLVEERWPVPSLGWVKINSDVAIDFHGRHLDFGVVFYNSAGKVLVLIRLCFLGFSLLILVKL